MVNSNLKAFGRSKGWHQTKEQVFGLYNGFQCSIESSSWLDNPRQTVVNCLFSSIDQSTQNILTTFLKENKKKIGHKDYQLSDVYIVLIFLDTWSSTKAEKLEQALNSLTNELSRLELRPAFAEGHTDFSRYNHYNQSGLGLLLLSEDYQAIKQEIDRDNQQRLLERTSYLSGAAGAFLFTLPIIIIWVLVAYYFNIITTIGGVLISLAAYYGYDKLKGKEDVGMKIILVLATVIAIIIANVATFHVQFMEYGLNFSESMDLIQHDPEVKTAFQSELGISMFFGLIGIAWVVFGLSTKPNYIKPAEKVS